MAKQSGLGWTTMSVDDSAGTLRDIRNDCTNLDFATPAEVQDITGLDKSAYERILLLRDFKLDLEGVFNTSANMSHAVFKTLTNVRTVTIGIGGATLTNECLFSDYSLTRDTSGAFTWKAPGLLADGTVPTWA